MQQYGIYLNIIYVKSPCTKKVLEPYQKKLAIYNWV